MQIPALDALRTLAVLLVIVMHVTRSYTSASGSENLFSRMPFVSGGYVGVDLFFVLSGYFIGKQLWREVQKTKSVDIKRFVLRRGFRIWPLYFAFFVTVMLVLRSGLGASHGGVHLPPYAGWSDVLFLTNYIPRGIVLGSWSLCTEEQFYLLAPAALALAAPRLTTIGACRKFLWALLAAFTLSRAATWWSLTHDFSRHDPALFHDYIYFGFHTHADGLVMGLILSNAEVDTGDTYKKGFLASRWPMLLAVVGVAVMHRLQREVLTFTGITLFFGAVTWRLLSRRTAARSFLDAKAFYVISRLSFGMYLNHEYMATPLARLMLAHLPFAQQLPVLHNIVTVALATGLSAAFAAVTFVLIEHPFLEMRAAVPSLRA